MPTEMEKEIVRRGPLVGRKGAAGKKKTRTVQVVGKK